MAALVSNANLTIWTKMRTKIPLNWGGLKTSTPPDEHGTFIYDVKRSKEKKLQSIS